MDFPAVPKFLTDTIAVLAALFLFIALINAMTKMFKTVVPQRALAPAGNGDAKKSNCIYSTEWAAMRDNANQARLTSERNERALRDIQSTLIPAISALNTNIGRLIELAEKQNDNLTELVVLRREFTTAKKQ